MEALGSDSAARTAFAERLALLYKEAGNPPLKRVSEAVTRLERIDERGRPVRVSAQRISDWRRAKNVPAQFAALAAVLQVLIPQARRIRSVPVSPGLYDVAEWQRLWERAVADPVADRPAGETPPEEPAPDLPAAVCPYRGLAAYRLEDARWFFGRERSTEALLAQLRAVEDSGTGGLVMLVGASGAGKSSLLNAGLVPALRDAGARRVLQLVPGADPLGELCRLVPGLGDVVAGAPDGADDGPEFARAVREAFAAWAGPGARPVVIVDQFEETFTLCAEEADRRTFIRLLHAACSPDGIDASGGRGDRGRPGEPGRPGGSGNHRDPGGLSARGRPDDRDGSGDSGRRSQPGHLGLPGLPGLPGLRGRPGDLGGPDHPARAGGPGSPASRDTPSGPVDYSALGAPTGRALGNESPGAPGNPSLSSPSAPAHPSERAPRTPATPTEPATEPTPAPTPPVLVLLGIRADFYDQCLHHPELADALQHRHMVLGPLTTAELREAVTGPAKAVGLELEPGLAELIVREVSSDGPRGAHDAGVLPLLSHALLATWQRRKAGRLTLAGYRAAGGIQGAVAATAERAWSGLDPAARTAARLLLLRLVRVGEDTAATRRRGTRRQLAEESADPRKTEESLEALVRARLVTLDADTVEITHEALLHAWPRLREWIDEDRGGNLLRQRLEEDGRAWEASHRDPALLYRGSRLEQAESWAKSAGNTYLTRGAVEFLAASVRLRRRTAWLSRGAVATLVALALVAVGAAVVAFQQRDDAVFEQVVAEADRVQYTDPSLSAQLDLVAHRLRPDDAGTNNRLISIVNAPLATPLLGHTGAVYLTSFSPDGRTLATASYDRTVRLWNVADPTRPAPLGAPLAGHRSWVSSAVFSPDGRTLASAGDDGVIRLWDVRDPAHPRPLGTPLTGHEGTVYLVAFSPDGRTLASASEDRTVGLWDVSDPGRAGRVAELTGHRAAVRSVAFAPDGRTLAAGGDDHTIRLWDVADPRRARALGTLSGHTETVHSVAFSPDGRTLASGGGDDTVRLWDPAGAADTAQLGPPLTAHTGPVWSVAFSPDGRTLAAASADSTASLWNVSDPAYPSQVGEPLAGSSGEMYALGFSPDGRTLATGSGDSKVRLWTVPTSDMIGRSGAFRPDGRVLATAARDGKVRLWDVRRPARPVRLGRAFMPGDGGERALAFSPDGHLLAVQTLQRSVHLWDVTDPAHPVAAGPPIALRTRFASPDALAFAPDGRTLATAYDDRTVRLWNVADPARPVPLGAPLTGHKGYVNALVFSPDGHTLASSSADGTVRLWNVTDPARATRLDVPLTDHRGPINVLAFSPDGSTLAGGGDDDTVRLWDLSDPARGARPAATLTGHTEAVVSLTFSRDGRTLASGGNDNTVRLWDVASPADAAPIGQSMSPNAKTGNFLSFSPAGHMLGVSSGTDTVRLWNLDVDSAIRHICATTRGVLTREKWNEYLPRLSYDPPCEE
ncbi:AAA family ATPase [Streptomyces sp. NPDC052687]|uniref:nSTAND1 domain-containing NTPase n=1 Tax=Streptomyces sp. NPDC052687 TaxID=3154759 RepID=UPI0034463819